MFGTEWQRILRGFLLAFLAAFAFAASASDFMEE
jgi:hypothetical protein